MIEQLLDSTYVCIVSGADSEDERFEFYAMSKELFRCEEFNLQSFRVGSPL